MDKVYILNNNTIFPSAKKAGKETSGFLSFNLTAFGGFLKEV
jgi:hypothetical protein